MSLFGAMMFGLVGLGLIVGLAWLAAALHPTQSPVWVGMRDSLANIVRTTWDFIRIHAVTRLVNACKKFVGDWSSRHWGVVIAVTAILVIATAADLLLLSTYFRDKLQSQPIFHVLAAVAVVAISMLPGFVLAAGGFDVYALLSQGSGDEDVPLAANTSATGPTAASEKATPHQRVEGNDPLAPSGTEAQPPQTESSPKTIQRRGRRPLVLGIGIALQAATAIGLMALATDRVNIAHDKVLHPDAGAVTNTETFAWIMIFLALALALSLLHGVMFDLVAVALAAVLGGAAAGTIVGFATLALGAVILWILMRFLGWLFTLLADIGRALHLPLPALPRR